MINEITEQLKRDEGFGSKPYTDTMGCATIGYGRNLTANGISPTEAEYMLYNDIQTAQDALRARFPWAPKLDNARWGVLINMAFQLGIDGLSEFRTFLALVEAGEYDQASAEMLNSLWAKQVPSRAQRLSIQMRTGHWQ